ncbi:MAG: tetratricopeptide repeat protein [Desulfobacterales bacterium]|nr:tetratricopeptide repeat protein [Desulfobacterales bacterium]
MAAKKVTRKQLLKEPDEFITFSARLFQFALKYKTRLLAGVGLVCAVLILLSGLVYFSKKSEEKAFSLMQQGLAKYKTLSQTIGTAKAYQEVNADFEFILKKYSSKEGGKLARVSYADICYKAGEYDKAISLYRESLETLGDHQPVKYLVLSGLGYSYAAKQAYQEAATYFQKISSGPESIMKDESLFNLGRIYHILGNPEKSKASYEKIVSDHPDSIYMELAKDKLAG